MIIDPGTYLWITPTGRHFLVDHRGTRALDPPRRLGPNDPPPYTGEPCPEAQRLAEVAANAGRNRRRAGRQLRLFDTTPADEPDH